MGVTGERSSLLKTLGYGVSTLSVMLLGIVSWKTASQQPVLFACLIAGMAASGVGMFLRWLSHRMDTKEKQGAVGQLAGARRAPGIEGGDHDRLG